MSNRRRLGFPTIAALSLLSIVLLFPSTPPALASLAAAPALPRGDKPRATGNKFGGADPQGVHAALADAGKELLLWLVLPQGPATS